MDPKGELKLSTLISSIFIYNAYLGLGILEDLPYIQQDPNLFGDVVFRSVVFAIYLTVSMILVNELIRGEELMNNVNFWIRTFRNFGGELN